MKSNPKAAKASKPAVHPATQPLPRGNRDMMRSVWVASPGAKERLEKMSKLK